MKRVLNSGTVRLPNVIGTDIKLDELVKTYLQSNEFMKLQFSGLLEQFIFKFEIKAPLLVLNAFQEAHLGILTRLKEQDHEVAYLPPQFYKKDGVTYNIMDAKACNVYNTKLYNFYSAAFNFYNNLVKEGMCPEQAALILPQGVFINFLWEIDVKDLIEFIEENYNKSPEMYGYASTLVLYLEEQLPILTKWLKVHRWNNYSL